MIDVDNNPKSGDLGNNLLAKILRRLGYIKEATENPAPVTIAGDVTLAVQDVEIGAVELKDGESDTRALITTDAPGHNAPALAVRQVEDGGLLVHMHPPAADSFGRLRISYPITLFEAKQIYDNTPLRFDDQETSGGGTSSTYVAAKAATTMGVSNLTAGTRVRQTFRRFNYQAGKSQLAFLTFTMGTAATGITRRAGLFDGSNGVFLEQTSAGAFFVIRNGGNDTRIAQADWNADKLNGAGPMLGNPSGITLNLANSQILMMDYEWLGVGTVRFGFVLNGQMVIAHEAYHANLVTAVYMQTPNLPIRFELSNSGSGGAATMDAICCSIMSEGGTERTGVERAIDRGATPLTTLNDSDIYPILGIRLKSTHLSATIDVNSFSFICDTTATFRFFICMNPTLAGTAAIWSDLANSAVQYSNTTTNATKVSAAGTVWHSGYGISTTFGATAPSSSLGGFFRLGSTIAGVSDELWVCAQRITGTTENFYAALNWHE